MLYPHNRSKELSLELFENPCAEYRGAPFWAWNCKLDKEQLLRQVDVFKEMGMGGFHVHARNGLATAYLSKEFLDLVLEVHAKAKGQGMLTWLYDEDRYPSGTAGGLVTKERPDLALKYLLWTPHAYGEIPVDQRVGRGRETCKENGTYLGSWAVVLNSKGFLVSYRRLHGDMSMLPDERRYHAYLESVAPQSWFNNQPCANVMDADAVDLFIQFTHQQYHKILGQHFGHTVPAIFTDEPHFVAKGNLSFALANEDITTTFTDDFEQSFRESYGYDLLDYLPEVFWDLASGKESQVRWHYNDHCAERFTKAFCKRIGSWCAKHNIMLTGHLMSERYLLGQTYAMSEAMRNYPAFELPGIDILADNREYTTAKQAQSIVRQYGLTGMLSEMYGVTDWSFDFRGHKLQGDWQAAMGVTVRVHHLSWVSMEGEAKRDYPASIFSQSPWYKEYKYLEDYFARLNTALSRGRASCRLAVIHPIESYWLRFGPEEHTGDERRQREENFQSLAEWLLHGHLDFDYICESLLPSLCKVGASPLIVGNMAYDAILVPDCITLRTRTVELLEDFAKAGGLLVFAGLIPAYVDALPSDRMRQLALRSLCVQHNRNDILQALNSVRMVDVISLESGRRVEGMVHQLRDDGADKWLFLCHTDHPLNPDIPSQKAVKVTVNGNWHVKLYNALNGSVSDVSYLYSDGSTSMALYLWPYDSVLLRLTPQKTVVHHTKSSVSISPTLTRAHSVEDRGKESLSSPKEYQQINLPLECAVTLSEPNVLILDWAEFSLDDDAFESEEEVLRIDEQIRHRLGWERRDGRLCQPYLAQEDQKYEHRVTLRFIIDSEVALDGSKLALERARDCNIRFNGQEIHSSIDGYYVDESIHTIPLPPILVGLNTLEVTVPIGRRVGIEACYLLGDFGVRVQGAKTKLVPPVRSLSFGDITVQGLPFYGGNITYHLPIHTKSQLWVCVPHFRNPLLSLDVDGKRMGIIAWAPYSLHADVAPEEHMLNLTAFGNRFNTFGSIHNADMHFFYPGNPGSWRTRGAAWSREYRLKPTGILVSPMVATK